MNTFIRTKQHKKEEQHKNSNIQPSLQNTSKKWYTKSTANL